MSPRSYDLLTRIVGKNNSLKNRKQKKQVETQQPKNTQETYVDRTPLNGDLPWNRKQESPEIIHKTRDQVIDEKTKSVKTLTSAAEQMKAARVRFSPSVYLNYLATRSRNGRKSLYARCNSSPCVPHCQRYRCCYRRCKSSQIKPMDIMLSINLFILKTKQENKELGMIFCRLYTGIFHHGGRSTRFIKFLQWTYFFVTSMCWYSKRALQSFGIAKTHQNPSKQHIQFVSWDLLFIKKIDAYFW